ncbi:LAME_0C03136g1_1 [Lachancea meyersii CBS 8951]|uniref:sterol esterase n=1 Tax=Lachancea meyersii CBS 8951 TaxID=1266667 RepID=A0A1G4J086_9SACH|nr:LAME_0C03136g1_1 [Lachancea meyersii CBS 8951]
MSLTFAYGIISTVITTCFLTVLFLCSLWHNLVAARFKSKDPRDTRSSHHNIKPRRSSRNSSAGSGTPLAIEIDRLNNIEFDHIITSPDTRPATATSTAPAPAPAATRDGDFERGRQGDNPFSDILSAEDPNLVPDLKHYYSQYGILIEEFEVETEDGFVLDLWHFTEADRGIVSSKRHPMLLLHGLLQSSGSFASGGRKSLAYYFHESGFDVWLGNNRCGIKPKWNQKTVKSGEKWNWDMREMVKYDLRALVTSVLEKTDKLKLTLVAHSQGTTQGFMGLANGEGLFEGDFQLINKVENFVALAPAVYPGPLLQEKLFVRFMSRFIDSPIIFGKRSFMPQMMVMRSLMVGQKLFSFLSYVMFNYLFDWNDTLWDRTLRDRHFLFSPVNISVKLMEWWLSQDLRRQSFKTYGDCIFPEEKIWFPVEDDPYCHNLPYHTNRAKESAEEYPRILLFVPKQDRLVDGERVINHFANFEPHSLYKCWYIDEYSHLDVLWAHDVISRIGRPILDNIRVTEDVA